MIEQPVSFHWIKMAHSVSDAQPKKRKRLRHVSIKALLAFTLLSATFASGYQSGCDQSEEFEYAELMRIIESTVVPDTWESLGGPSTLAPYPVNISCVGCYAEVIDHMADETDEEFTCAVNE